MELFRTQKLNDHLYRICDITDVQMYLVIGRHTAALIDTGCGFGDLYEVLRKLTDKPVIVLLTHGHVDHAMGAAHFDVIYMNRMDIPIFAQHSQTEMRVDYVRQATRFEPAVLKTMVPPITQDRFLPVGDNAVFDLGGLHVRMLSCPGHTPGSMCALLEEDRVLITGDACNPLTFLFMPESMSISEYRESLESLRSQAEGRFDTVYFSHGFTDGQKSILTDAMNLCDEILKGQCNGAREFHFMDCLGMIAKPVDENLARTDGVLMNLVYDPKRLCRREAREAIMISNKSTKRELHSLSPDMASLMETVIVQGTEEEWSSGLFPADGETNQAAFATVSHIYEATQRGVKCIYELYTEEEKAADESKRQTKLIYSPGEPGMPFVFLTPGGAFLMVDFLGEGLPQAHELNKLGYHVFLLKYRVGLPDTLSLALEDVHRALRLILSVGKDLGIDTSRYASMGNSAGGYLAGEWGVRELGYGKYDDPKPSSVLLAYPACSLQCCYEDYLRGDPDASFMFVMPLYLKNILGDGFTLEDTKRLSLEYQIDEAFSPVFVVWNEDDEYVHKDGFYRLKDRIEQSGIPHEIEIYPSGRHGFGAGYCVQARGWVERAIRFWENNTQTQHD